MLMLGTRELGGLLREERREEEELKITERHTKDKAPSAQSTRGTCIDGALLLRVSFGWWGVFLSSSEHEAQGLC